MYNIRVLSRDDIRQVVELKPVIECVESVYRAKSLGETVVWPTTFYEFDPGHADMDIKSGYLKKEKIFGHKTVSWFGGNKAKNLPDLSGIIVVYDAQTGLPQGVLDASYITGVRTGAAGAIGAKYLAREDSRTLFLLGAGNQAFFQIAAVLTLFSGIEKIMVADVVNPENAQRFVKDLPTRLQAEFGISVSGLQITAENDLSASVPQADIVITVTPAKSPVIKKNWIAPGTHLSCIGADAAGKEEIEPEIFAGAKLFVDDKVHCIGAGETEIPLKRGVIAEDDIVGEIGDLLLGKVEGRTSDSDITIFDATGMALLDIAAAKTALALAEKKNLGMSAVL